jgi:hypothetical protein
MTFPDIPEKEILEVKLYDLSEEIKKCLRKKVVKDAKKTDLKTWFPELVDQDVPAALPMWSQQTPGQHPRQTLRAGLTPCWGVPGASPNPYDMGRSQSLGMGASPQLGDRQSFASAQSHMSMSALPSADYQGAITAEQFHEFKQYQQQAATAKAQASLQSPSQANQQASNPSSGEAQALKRKDQDKAQEQDPAKKAKTGVVVN